MLFRKKIYIGSRDENEKADDTLLVRKLVQAVFIKALQHQKANSPIPDSFKHLFGEDAVITSAVRAGDPDAFQYASPGGAIYNRETVLLSVLSGKTASKITSTDGIKESLLSSIHCVSTVENPVGIVDIAAVK